MNLVYNREERKKKSDNNYLFLSPLIFSITFDYVLTQCIQSVKIMNYMYNEISYVLSIDANKNSFTREP